MQWTLNVIPVYVMAVTSLLSGVLGAMDQATKDHILKLHNDYRRNEGASDMTKMVWNNTLEQQAASWAAICNFEHKGMGENMAWNSRINEKETDLIDFAMRKFYNETYQYSYGQYSCRPSACHYTQMMWAKTTDVGCATHKCGSLSNSFYNKEAWFLVCRYEPAGNWDGQKPFKKGSACSECEAKDASCDKGLCSVCKDKSNECAGWAKRGECDANPEYMHKNCKKSCNKC